MPNVRWVAVTVYTALVIGITWLWDHQLVSSGGPLSSPKSVSIMAASMFIPTLCTVITHLVVPGRDWRASFGSFRGVPIRNYALALLAPAALILASFVLSVAFGVFEHDLQNLSVIRAAFERNNSTETLSKISPHSVAALGLFFAMFVAPFINMLPALGEEVGWRGFLLTELLPLGEWPAIIISNVIWGVWHVPVNMLGYNYPMHPQLGCVVFTSFCVLCGALLSWLRIDSDSVLAAALAHGSLNALAGGMGVLARLHAPVDTLYAGITGLVGQGLLLVVVLLLARRRRLRRLQQRAQASAVPASTNTSAAAAAAGHTKSD